MMAFLKSRWFIALIGVALLSLIIWFGGPFIAIADHKPLDGPVPRLVAILVLVLLYAIIVTFTQLRAAQAGRKLAEGVSAAATPAAAASGSDKQLRQRFEEATRTLQSTRRGRSSLYELPWYVIIGPPGAGKSTLVQGAGLNFPLEQKFGRNALRGVGGTRNCDWWFTDEAIFLDTAGRFTTQDASAQEDAQDWLTFLRLLKKYRGRQPLNGALVGLSVTDLLTKSDAEREALADSIRERLKEIRATLRISPPVYLLLTKCDLLAGFTEFFDDMGNAARAQVWGTTFPIQRSQSGQATDLLAAEFDLLVERIQLHVIDRLEAERDVGRRVALMAFPQQFASLKAVLVSFLSDTFSGSQFDSNVMLRGVYFTSGTQAGTPLDRMLQSIAGAFGISALVAPPADLRPMTFFIERLVKQVIFPEAGLAGVNRRLQLQKFALHSGGYVACLLVSLLVVLVLVVSYRRNLAYVHDVSSASQALAATEPPLTTPLDASLAYLDGLKSVADAAEVHERSVPWSMRAGLYRGHALGGAARDAYVRELNLRLLPLLAKRFESKLAGAFGHPDRLYELLKGYLMLGDAKHRNADHLLYLAAQEWTELSPTDGAIRQSLTEHFEQLTSDPKRMTSVAIDPDTVARSRAALQTASLPMLMYSRLKVSYFADKKRALRLDLTLGPGAELALRRPSGAKLTDPVPALYTRPVFNEINVTGKFNLMKQFAEDQWVFGDAFDLKNASRLNYQVMQVYEQDYIRYWDALIADVQPNLGADALQLRSALEVLSGPASPLKAFLGVVVDNTDLTKADGAPADKALGAVESAVAAKAPGLGKLLGDDTPAGQDKPGTLVAKHFETLRKSLEGPPGGTQMDRTLAALAQINQIMKNAGGGVGAVSNADPAVLKGIADAQQLISNEVKQLPTSVADAVMQISGKAVGMLKGEAAGELARKYEQYVVRECRELVENRYPFTRSNSNDVSLEDFAHLFSDGGTYDKFFRDNLLPLVDTSRGVWQWRDGAAPPAGTRGLLGQFQAAQRVKEMFFKAGAKPEVKFNLTPDSLDGAVTRFTLAVDGQSLEYRHGPLETRGFLWPNGTSGAVTVTFEVAGTPTVVGFQGPWALFRLLDSAKLTTQSDTKFLLTIMQAGRSARLVLDASSVRNPFVRNDLQSFRCGS